MCARLYAPINGGNGVRINGKFNNFAGTTYSAFGKVPSQLKWCNYIPDPCVRANFNLIRHVLGVRGVHPGEASSLISQLWIKGMSSLQMIHEKVKDDPTFGQRLLDYISQVVEGSLPEDLDLLEEDEDESRLCQPYTPPNYLNFNHAMRKNLGNLVRYCRIHKRSHIPPCFKYGSKKCRSRFPCAL
jgi:hypothetical protein